jgi:hypothetical protein
MKIQVVNLADKLWLDTLHQLRYDIYHLPEYVALESRRNKAIPEAILIVDNEKIFFVPYLLRQCNDMFNGELASGEVFDVVSPYGYPGILLNEAAASVPEFIEFAINQMMQVFRDKHVSSAFLRLHPILNQEFNNICTPDTCKVSGETVSIDLKLSDAEIWHQTRPEHRNKINKCKRYGLTARTVPFQQNINEFITIYEETMARVGASQFYYFDCEYFLHLVNALGEKLHLCIVELEEQAVCGGLFTECCGIVQYHLGGTRSEFLKQAPSKLMFDYVRFWAKERGNEVFHLGGGVGGAKDSLYHFKAGFSKQRHTFLTLRLITDKKKYLHLVDLRAKYLNTNVEKLLKTDFFPAYRSLKLE